VPHRDAEEHLLEVHVIDPGAPTGRQVRVVRRRYVTARWSWLPLARGADEGGPMSARQRVRLEGLSRAFDDALDEALGLADDSAP
jgi:hypothetical protein